MSSDSLSIEEMWDDVPPRLHPMAVLVLLIILALSGGILYNTLFAQNGGRLGDLGARSGATRMVVNAGEAAASTVVLRVDPLIEQIQRELAQAGDYAGPVDGVAGKGTRLGIESYQRANSLDVTGEATQELLDHIRYRRELLAAAGLDDAAPVPDGDPVKRVQIELAELGYLPGLIDGHLGEQTRDAIRQFEHDRGLAPTGTVTEALLAELAKTSGTTQAGQP